MSAFLPSPAGSHYWITDLRVPSALTTLPRREEFQHLDLEIRDGRIVSLAPVGTAPTGALDGRGGLCFPVFSDLHTHLDKGHIWPRMPNPDGTFAGALNAVRTDRQVRWSYEDVFRRFEFGLRASLAHGTGAVRTHIDTYPGQAEISWKVFRDLRDAWSGRLKLQAVSIVAIDLLAGAFGDEVGRLVAESGGVLGAVTRLQGGVHDALPADFDAQLIRLFEIAEHYGLDLDLHVDESGDAGAVALGAIARTAIARSFKGRIVCGHCCSLAIQPDAIIRTTIDAVAEAGIGIVSLPMCNMFLQDRMAGRTPRWRGITLLHEFAAAGVPIAVASDNCRDPFYGYGDHDMVEVYREATRIAQLDCPVGDWPRAVTTTPARLMDGTACLSVAVGAEADLVLFRSRAWHEFFARPQADRVVVRGGRFVDTTPPDYADLDDLMGSP